MYGIGKIIGAVAGAVIGESVMTFVIGALLGAVLDFYFVYIENAQRKRDTLDTKFAHLFVMLHAKFAKMDGQVTSAEVRAFQDIIDVSDVDEPAIRALYNHYRKSADGFEHVALEMADRLGEDEASKLKVLESLCIVGCADEGKLNLHQGAFIHAVAKILAVDVALLESVKRRVHEQYSAGAYVYENTSHHLGLEGDMDPKALSVLGLTPPATVEDVKKAYKKAIRTHHPDKVRGEGASDALVKKAERKLAEINEAYALLMDN